ncbi:restriction endonuclease [Clostridium sp. BSD9I1]|uniref:restriction endonuclease n=1 Tax=Clostridium sp. BSD9I1 TaxID=2003589 RepID=UPI0016474809|nr:restriction endonuclease [Clostridium sp. BSD9I1]
MIKSIISFLYNNFNTIVLVLFLAAILYSWISMFINKDYRYIAEYNRRFRDRVLTSEDLQNIKHEIEHMEGREFEIFSEWLFKNMGKYKSVTLTPATNDEGRDLILVDRNDATTFVECKRYTDNATTTENFMIGREICQKLVGAIVAEGIKQGIIITTGNVHQNAWDYIVKLEKNSTVGIQVMTSDDIMRTIQEINKAEVLRVVGLA